MVQKIFKIGNKLQPKKGMAFEGIKAEVVSVKEDKFQGKPVKRYLLKAKGLKGAGIVTGYCKECKQAIIEKMPDHRWYYDFMVEESD